MSGVWCALPKCAVPHDIQLLCVHGAAQRRTRARTLARWIIDYMFKGGRTDSRLSPSVIYIFSAIFRMIRKDYMARISEQVSLVRCISEPTQRIFRSISSRHASPTPHCVALSLLLIITLALYFYILLQVRLAAVKGQLAVVSVVRCSVWLVVAESSSVVSRRDAKGFLDSGRNSVSHRD